MLRPDCKVLKMLGDQFAFEMAVGINGRVWVSANTHARTLLVTNAILASENMSDVEQEKLVRTLLKSR